MGRKNHSTVETSKGTVGVYEQRSGETGDTYYTTTGEHSNGCAYDSKESLKDDIERD